MTSNIILDSHRFNIDTSCLAQWKWAGGQELPSGRYLYRHSSNEGSVIEFDYWGTPMKLFVADAKYRATNLAYDATNRSHGNPQLTVTTAWFSGSQNNRKVALAYTKDDAWIQSTYTTLKNDGTARSNTDILMGFTTTKAAHHCRDQDIPGVGQLDMPNLYELIILYLESDHIDALDPTVESNRDKALGMMNTNGRFHFNQTTAVRSSTELSPNKSWCVGYGGRAWDTGNQSDARGVVPVKELDV